MFLDQSQKNAYNGFIPGESGADTSFGECLQCAAVDRSRYKVTPIVERSDFCTNCFKRYCYDPANEPKEGSIVGRNLKYRDPDPFGAKSFFQDHKAVIIVGGIVGLAGFIGVLVGSFMLFRRQDKVMAFAKRSLNRMRGKNPEAEQKARIEHVQFQRERGQYLHIPPREQTHWRKYGSHSYEMTASSSTSLQDVPQHSPGFYPDPHYKDPYKPQNSPGFYPDSHYKGSYLPHSPSFHSDNSLKGSYLPPASSIGYQAEQQSLKFSSSPYDSPLHSPPAHSIRHEQSMKFSPSSYEPHSPRHHPSGSLHSESVHSVPSLRFNPPEHPPPSR